MHDAQMPMLCAFLLVVTSLRQNPVPGLLLSTVLPLLVSNPTFDRQQLLEQESGKAVNTRKTDRERNSLGFLTGQLLVKSTVDEVAEHVSKIQMWSRRFAHRTP
jgi:hypothetical protein